MWTREEEEVEDGEDMNTMRELNCKYRFLRLPENTNQVVQLHRSTKPQWWSLQDEVFTQAQRVNGSEKKTILEAGCCCCDEISNKF